MENIILTNNKDLRLVGVKVGVLSTLRFELPLVSASATHVEVIVTSGNVHSAYTATFIDDTKRWQCDIAASQFPEVGKQSYEIAYVLDGKQFWDGKGWIEIEDATTSGIEPQPRPEPYRYAVVSVNGYGADAQGAVRIPKTFISTNSPTTTDGFMEGDIYFNRETGATWTLCNVQGTLTWVFNFSNYYTKAETDEQIDKLAAYYITSDVQGNPFATHAALVNAATYYSGGSVRVPTRNDYAVVLADETHDGAEYRYIYAVADGETVGQWEAQYPVEGVMTVDQTVTKDSQNPVSGGGVWSAIWGTASTAFSSLYDWVVAQLADKASKSDVDPLLFAQYYPDGSVKSTTEFTPGIKYDDPDTSNRTITVRPFCDADNDSKDDNSNLSGRVVIPPFVDAQRNPHISDDGTRYRVVGVSGCNGLINISLRLTAIVAPNTVTSIGNNAFVRCGSLTSISLPSATTIGESAFKSCTSLTSVSLPSATTIGDDAFLYSDALASVDFGDTPRSSVPKLGTNAFNGVPTACKIIVPYTQYDAWIAASGWSALPQEFVRHAEKADKPATFTAGNLAKFDANGNPVDSDKKPSDFQSALTPQQLANIAAVPDKLASSFAAPAFAAKAYVVNDLCTYNGVVYRCKVGYTATASSATPDADTTHWESKSVSDLFLPLTGGDIRGSLRLGYGQGISPSLVIGGASVAATAGFSYTQLTRFITTSPSRTVVNYWPSSDGTFALTSDIPYSLGTPTVIDTASSETVKGETVNYGEATLANRTANIVGVAVALDELRVTFPPAVSGKVRDFGLYVAVGLGEGTALTAPALVPVAPTGETITLMNAEGEMPTLADGTTTASGTTVLYFTEVAESTFLVKGEQVQEVA